MGFLADKTVFSPLTKEILEESISFSCGNEDLDGFFHNDAVSYAENLFGKSYCYYLEESKADVVCAFTVSNASIFTKYLPNARKKKVGKHVPHIKQDLIYPAVLIGRLGISTKFQHLHIGTEVIDFIKSWFVEPYNKTGCLIAKKFFESLFQQQFFPLLLFPNLLHSLVLGVVLP